MSWPTSPTIPCTLRTLGLRAGHAQTRFQAGTSGRFGICVHLSENRGVPGSSPGLAIAKSLQNDGFAGYCGLPLQQTCPHPNACLTCDSFLTTGEFLPAHRDQLTRTEQLIAQAQAAGRQRLVDINEPVRLNLIRIIDGLQASEDAGGR
jgi:hypothetical protein